MSVDTRNDLGTAAAAKPKRWLHVLPLVVFFAIAFAAAYFLVTGRDPRLLPSTLIDKPAPQFTLTTIAGWEGKKPGLATADLKGKVTVVNFFASWCIPCLAEHPHITALSRDKDIQVVGINYKNEAADAIAWLNRHGDPYAKIGADKTGRVGIDWGVYGMPETFIVDRNGRIRFKQVGPITPEILRTKILPVIAELKK